MKVKHFTLIKRRCAQFTHNLQKKHPILLQGMAISILSENDFRQSLQAQEITKQIYFTSDELAYCKNRISSLAGRLAAKMAIKKALQKNIPWKKINIISSQTGEPALTLLANTNFSISFSISHENDLIIAIAVCFLPGNTVSVGIDAASITRFSKLLPQKKIIQQILTNQEIKEINNLPEKLAEKWAAKEAVSKAIGIGIWHGSFLQDIEILTQNKKPLVKLNGKISKQAKTKGLNNWILKYIHDKDFVLAIVLASN